STLVRYLLASIGALAVDSGCFFALLVGGCPAIAAAAAGYALGVVVHWLLSSRTVFAETAAPGGAARHRQKALFAGSALIGLGLTAAIVGVATALGLEPRLGKVVAIAASFAATWLMRERIVFR
ncbi:MAG: GtrA family protein, partial [Novosphingobium sp.]